MTIKNTLEKLVQKAVNTRIGKLALIPLTALSINITTAQNIVTGHVESALSGAPAIGRVSFKNLATGEYKSALTDTLTGDYKAILPSGQWMMTDSTQNQYLYTNDTINVTDNMIINKKMIPDSAITSSYYNNNLEEYKYFFLKKDQDPQPLSTRYSMFPIRVKADTTNTSDSSLVPVEWRSALNNMLDQYTVKTFGKLQFDVAQTDSTWGISIQCLWDNQLPPTAQGSLGYTFISAVPGQYIRGAIEYINKSYNTPEDVLPTLFREMWNGLGGCTISLDPTMISYWGGASSYSLHHDEGLAMALNQALDEGTNLKKYREVKINYVPNNAPNLPVLVSPASNDTSVSTKQDVVFRFNATDSDNDQLFSSVHIFGPGLDTTVNRLTDTELNISGDKFQSGQTYNWNVNTTDNWNSTQSPTYSFTTSSGGSYVKEISDVANTFNLEQNFPNPFNPETTIRYSIKQNAHVKIGIYNTLGQLVSEIDEGIQRAGSYEKAFNASHLPSGVYLYRINAGDYVDTKKMVLLK